MSPTVLPLRQPKYQPAGFRFDPSIGNLLRKLRKSNKKLSDTTSKLETAIQELEKQTQRLEHLQQKTIA
jgi:prefoldin subunit 5